MAYYHTKSHPNVWESMVEALQQHAFYKKPLLFLIVIYMVMISTYSWYSM